MFKSLTASVTNIDLCEQNYLFLTNVFIQTLFFSKCNAQCQKSNIIHEYKLSDLKKNTFV